QQHPERDVDPLLGLPVRHVGGQAGQLVDQDYDVWVTGTRTMGPRPSTQLSLTGLHPGDHRLQELGEVELVHPLLAGVVGVIVAVAVPSEEWLTSSQLHAALGVDDPQLDE